MWMLLLTLLTAEAQEPEPTDYRVVILEVPPPEGHLRTSAIMKVNRGAKGFFRAADFGSTLCFAFTDTPNDKQIVKLVEKVGIVVEGIREATSCSEPPKESFRAPPAVASRLYNLASPMAPDALKLKVHELLRFPLDISAAEVPNAETTSFCLEFQVEPKDAAMDIVFKTVELPVAGSMTVEDCGEALGNPKED